jgi:hypothetical protein
MSGFQLFEYLDPAIVRQESRDPKPSTVPSVWPSEASATRIDQRFWLVVGKCMRQSYLRMLGRPVSDQVDAKGAWKWVTGREMEGIVVDLAQATDPNIYVANGVKHYVPDIYLPFELDLVVRDPLTNRAWIAECKTYDGYYAEKEIEVKGQPKLENLMQAAIYLLEVPTGKKMKEIIYKSLEDRQRLDSLGAKHRNRIDANLEAVDKLSDGPTGQKLIYISRGEVNRTEFTIEVQEDFDGSHYPVVNGQMLKIFTVESIYERYKMLQNHWFNARVEGVKRLAAKDINPPEGLSLVLAPGDGNGSRYSTDEDVKAKEYLDLLARETWKLGVEFLPPAEYQWAYTAEKIEQMWAAGELTKKAYEGWKKKGLKVGDWQCKYCAHKSFCVPLMNPLWAHEVYDQDLVTIST